MQALGMAHEANPQDLPAAKIAHARTLLQFLRGDDWAGAVVFKGAAGDPTTNTWGETLNDKLGGG